MKNYFIPDYMFENIYAITPEFLMSLGVKALVLDIDNTLVTYGTAEPTEEIISWVRGMESAGLYISIASNNHKERVDKFNERLGVFTMYESGKPSKRAVNTAAEHFSVSPKECAVIGDQIFTDVLCASRAGAFSILVTPLKYKENLFFKFKRLCEKPFIRAYKRRERRRMKRNIGKASK
ncbi:MAG: YqeG family HAD IIIA-type phosphatase [Eubacteriales bacterium]